MSSIDRKQREFDRREREILRCALELCSTPAWETVTVSQIAERAEIGKGTVYTHFASKDELLFRLMLDFYRGLLKLLSAETPPQVSPIARLRSSVEQALRYHIQHKHYRYIVEYCQRCDFRERADPRWKADFLQLDQAFQAWAEPILTAGMEQKRIERRPARDLMLGISAAFKGAVSMVWAGEDWCPLGDEETVVRAVSDFVMTALIGQVGHSPVAGENL